MNGRVTVQFRNKIKREQKRLMCNTKYSETACWTNGLIPGDVVLGKCFGTRCLRIALLQVVDDGIGEFGGRILAAQILGTNLARLQHSHHRSGDQIAVALQIHVAQQLGAAQQHCRGIGEILADGLGEGVSRTLWALFRR